MSSANLSASRFTQIEADRAYTQSMNTISKLHKRKRVTCLLGDVHVDEEIKLGTETTQSCWR